MPAFLPYLSPMTYAEHSLAKALIESERQKAGWGEEQAAWAERLVAAFAKGAFWRSSKAEKEGLYCEVAQEIVTFVGVPMGAPSEVEWWSALLAARFGGLDFWRLPAVWKQLHCEGVVREVFLVKRLAQERPLLGDVNEPLTEAKTSLAVDIEPGLERL